MSTPHLTQTPVSYLNQALANIVNPTVNQQLLGTVSDEIILLFYTILL